MLALLIFMDVMNGPRLTANTSDREMSGEKDKLLSLFAACKPSRLRLTMYLANSAQ